MKRESLLYGLIGFLIGGIFVWILTINTVRNSNNSMMQMIGMYLMENQNTKQGAKADSIDRHFIEQMVPHHEDAITMAEIALEKGEHPEIINLAENIIKTQTAENDQMNVWYKAWFGIDVPENNQVSGMHGMRARGGMHMGIMGDDTDMEALRNTSKFDKEFIEQMIPHHQMAIMMSQMLRSATHREEMKKLAANITSTQTKEINEMRQWYKNWNY